jgi:hypothetical protein
VHFLFSTCRMGSLPEGPPYPLGPDYSWQMPDYSVGPIHRDARGSLPLLHLNLVLLLSKTRGIALSKDSGILWTLKTVHFGQFCTID